MLHKLQHCPDACRVAAALSYDDTRSTIFVVVFKKECVMQPTRFVRWGLFTGLMVAQVTAVHAFNVEELADDELSCQALYDGVREMDVRIANAKQAQSQAQTQRASGNSNGGLIGQIARESGSSEGANAARIFGNLLSMAGAQAAPAQPVVTESQAQARKQHLSRIFRDKKCKVSTLRK
jgi:hypothetical protein